MRCKILIAAVLALVALPAFGRPRAGVASGSGTAFSLLAGQSAASNWGNAGLALIGGIPTRSTVCTTVNPSGITPPAAGDDLSLINAAIAGCTAGQVVQLGSATCGTSCAFQFAFSELPIALNKGVTLRGYGSCSGSVTSMTYATPVCVTSLNVRDGNLPYTGGKCGVSTGAEVTCPNGGPSVVDVSPVSPDYNYSWQQCGNAGAAIGTGCGGIPLSVDAAQGQTTIQVASTTGFVVGNFVKINEASGGGWEPDPMNALTGFGSIWASADWLNSSPTSTVNGAASATAKVSWSKAQNTGSWDFGLTTYPYQASTVGCWHEYCDRPTVEIHKVAAVGAGPCPGTSCTVTFDDPLTIAFRRSGPVAFTGSISGTTLTANTCSLAIGQMIQDTNATPNVSQGTYITATGTCSGGTSETYTVSVSQTVVSEALQAGAHGALVYPVYYPNQSGTGGGIAFLQQTGVENLSIMRAPNAGINFNACAYCWAKNVDISEWTSGAINVENSVRVEITGSYLHHSANSVNNGGEYPLAIDEGSTEILVDNNIFAYAGKGMVARAGGAGSVVAYNVFDDEMYDSNSGIGDYWRDQSANASHYSGPHHVLFEGNWADSLDNDNTHGNSTYITFYRNDSTGLRTPFYDPSIGGAGSGYNQVNDATGVAYACLTTGPTGCSAQSPGPLRAIGPMTYNYWFAFAGNVLGESGVTTTANGWTYSGDWTGKRIMMPGWGAGLPGATTQGGQDPYLDGVSGTYELVNGNYDYVTGGVTWISGAQTLPNSLYLTAAPSFFSAGTCTYPWPWVTPTSGTQLQPNSCSGSGLPAKARWDAGTPFVQP